MNTDEHQFNPPKGKCSLKASVVSNTNEKYVESNAKQL